MQALWWGVICYIHGMLVLMVFSVTAQLAIVTAGGSIGPRMSFYLVLDMSLANSIIRYHLLLLIPPLHITFKTQ